MASRCVRLNAYWGVYTSLKFGKHCTRFDTPVRITDISVISEYSACSILLVFKNKLVEQINELITLAKNL